VKHFNEIGKRRPRRGERRSSTSGPGPTAPLRGPRYRRYRFRSGGGDRLRRARKRWFDYHLRASTTELAEPRSRSSSWGEPMAVEGVPAETREIQGALLRSGGLLWTLRGEAPIATTRPAKAVPTIGGDLRRANGACFVSGEAELTYTTAPLEGTRKSPEDRSRAIRVLERGRYRLGDALGRPSRRVLPVPPPEHPARAIERRREAVLMEPGRSTGSLRHLSHLQPLQGGPPHG
jgi:hypothetical protein